MRGAVEMGGYWRRGWILGGEEWDFGDAVEGSGSV